MGVIGCKYCFGRRCLNGLNLVLQDLVTTPKLSLYYCRSPRQSVAAIKTSPRSHHINCCMFLHLEQGRFYLLMIVIGGSQ